VADDWSLAVADEVSTFKVSKVGTTQQKKLWCLILGSKKEKKCSGNNRL